MDLGLLCQCICQVICCIIILLYGILILIVIVLLPQLLVCVWVILLHRSQDMLLASLLQDALHACQILSLQAELLPVLRISIFQGAPRAGSVMQEVHQNRALWRQWLACHVRACWAQYVQLTFR